MKILIISPTQSGIGGVAQHVKELKNFLDDKGHYVEIISSENTFTIPIKGLKNPSFMISSYIKTKFAKNFDIVHAHNIPSAYAMKNVKGKKILTQHGIFSKQIEHLHGTTTGNLTNNFERNALKWADVITVISKEADEYYKKLGFKTIQIPNAINLKNLPLDEDRRFEKQIIFVGRLSKEKGIETIVEVSKKLPNDINLLIIGSGPESKKIKKLSETLDNIHYMGYQTHMNSIKLIRGSDVLIQPSLHEGISTTILESMACKIPVIASNVGGNKELILDNENGFLINPESADELIKKIMMILEDKFLAKKFGEKSFELIHNYEWSKIGLNYLELYESLLKK
ncbi:MAG: glycosyltransferase family 4 protein [Candidatus Nitrosopumilus sp. bin_7KS]